MQSHPYTRWRTSSTVQTITRSRRRQGSCSVDLVLLWGVTMFATQMQC